MRPIFSSKRLTIVMAAACVLLCGAATASAKDLTIRDCILETLQTNPEMRQFIHNKKTIELDLAANKGRYLPSVDATAAVGAGSTSNSVRRDNNEDTDINQRGSAGLKLTQRIYDGSETGSLVAEDEARLQSAERRVEDTAQSLGLDAVHAYMEVVRYRKLVELAEENVTTHRLILESLEERQRAGVGSIADVTQTKGRLARALSSLAEDKRNKTTAEAAYLKTVGSEAPDFLLPDAPGPLPYSTQEEALEAATKSNTRILALQADLAAAKQRVGVQSSALLPKVNLSVSTDYTHKNDSYTQENQAMVEASWNLFRGGSDVARRDAARESRLRTLAQLKDQIRTIKEEVTQTWSRYISNEEQIQLYSEAVVYNRQTSDAYLQQFNIGRRSMRDVLDAENESFQSSALLVTTQADKVIAHYRLLALTGKLLDEFKITPEVYLANTEDINEN